MLRTKKNAIALYLGYTIILTLLIFGGITIAQGINNLNLSRRNRTSTTALYAGEGALRAVDYNLAQSIANFETEATGSVLAATPKAISTLPYWKPPAGVLPSDFTITYTCQIIGTEQTFTNAQGAITKRLLYEISAIAKHNIYDVSVTLKQRINRLKTYTFQDAVFYNDDLEMLPGGNMILSGRIHCNNDIYAGSDGALLTISSDSLHTAGKFFDERKDTGARSTGDVIVQVAGSSPAVYASPLNSGTYIDSTDPTWITDSQARWNGTVQDGANGITTLTAPAVGSIQPTGYYATNAANNGLSITRTSSGWVIKSGGSSVPIGSFPVGTITENTFMDNRAGKNVTTIDINIAKLNTSGYFPLNGLLYVTRQDATASQPNGVRLTQGSQINSNNIGNGVGLTVVSNDPVYIKGDYNTITPDPNKPKGASVICDAVNILSNAWNDANSTKALANRDPSATEVDCAFIAGSVPTPTGGGTYSGGLENYPRLAEDWGGTTLTIKGSFVELWPSQIATATWQYGSPIYTAPTRAWSYDTRFNTSANLPPFTPFAVEIQPVAWWQVSGT
jgi:hypothetical protein